MIGCYQKMRHHKFLIDEGFYSLASTSLVVVCPLVVLFHHPPSLHRQLVFLVVAPNLLPQLVFVASYGQLLLLFMPQFQLLLFDMIP
jgi:hypothetical protein